MRVSLDEIKHVYEKLNKPEDRVNAASWATKLLLSDQLSYVPINEEKRIHNALLFLTSIDTKADDDFLIPYETIVSFIRDNNLYQDEKIYIDLDTIKKLFIDLIDGTQSREEVASRAFTLMTANDNGFLIYKNQEEAEIVWDSILYLLGVDLKVNKNEYLHSIDNFIDYSKEL